MSTNQILIGLGLTVFLAVGSPVLASRLRIPAIIVLLPVGFAAGALTSDVNPGKLLGSAFEPMVSLAVAVILYDAGLGLELGKLTGHPRRVVWRLIALGVPVSLGLAVHLHLGHRHPRVGPAPDIADRGACRRPGAGCPPARRVGHR